MSRAGRNDGPLARVSATVFTAVVAPILVGVTVQGLNAVVVNVPHEPRANAGCLSRAGGARDIFVNRGCGATLAEARRDALRSSLLQAAAQALQGTDPNEMVAALCEDIVKNPGPIVLRCDDLPRQPDDGNSTAFCRREVVVELAREPLLERLRAGHFGLKAE